jgi:4-aminobutyrate---pyruvate transaminase
MAKAMSSGYQAISATVINEDIYQAMVAQSEKIGVFGHGFSYSARPVACAVALETLKIYEEHEILEHVRDVAPVFQQWLHSLGSHPLVGEARGIGLIGAIELVRDKSTKAPFDVAAGVSLMAADLAARGGVDPAGDGDSLATLSATRHDQNRNWRDFRSSGKENRADPRRDQRERRVVTPVRGIERGAI